MVQRVLELRHAVMIQDTISRQCSVAATPSRTHTPPLLLRRVDVWKRLRPLRLMGASLYNCRLSHGKTCLMKLELKLEQYLCQGNSQRHQNPPKGREHNVCNLRILGFDHGVGHPLLLLCGAKVSNYRKNKECNDLGHYSEWPKVADAVIKAGFCK